MFTGAYQIVEQVKISLIAPDSTPSVPETGKPGQNNQPPHNDSLYLHLALVSPFRGRKGSAVGNATNWYAPCLPVVIDSAGIARIVIKHRKNAGKSFIV